MDRNDYKNLINEVNALIKSGGLDDALDLLDDVNWRKIRNVNALIEIASLYEKLGHIEDSKTLLTFAHDRSPIGRMILYHLTIVCVKMNELEEAKQHLEEFIQIAPHDSKKYILRYHIAEAEGQDIRELIRILEEMKSSDFIEEWAFELAYLYYKAGEADKCIALSDEIVTWFQDGPYVTKALELKMLYSPLDDEQATRYEELLRKNKGITHFKRNELLESGEVIRHDLDIAPVEETTGHLNTVNLQAEIKRNIEEIMEATKEGEVANNLENIKGLIEELPYLKEQEDLTEVASKVKSDNKKIDDEIINKFRELLDEEGDGQMSLVITEESSDEQLEGQMTIQDVMDNWAKTQRLAEEVLEDASDMKLKQAKEDAIGQANHIIDKLEDVTARINAGASASEIMREETKNQAIKVRASDEELGEDKDTEDKAEPADTEDKAEPVNTETEAEPEPVNTEIEEDHTNTETEAETGPKVKEYIVPKILSDGTTVAEGLRIPVIETDRGHISNWDPPKLNDDEPEITPVKLEDDLEEAEIELSPEAKEPEVSRISERVSLVSKTRVLPTISDIREEDTDADLESKTDLEPDTDLEPKKDLEPDTDRRIETDLEPKADLEPDTELDFETDLEPKTEMPIILTQEEKDIFSYFMPIDGMERAICKTLYNTKKYLLGKRDVGGHIIIQGIQGTGKTMLATSIVKVLQSRISLPAGSVGKVDGDKLNGKDIAKLFDKIKSGCLIIEKAGLINRETAIRLALMMDNDDSGILIILEDTESGINKVMRLSDQLSNNFTERIVIPPFTIDELVEFAKKYASDCECSIDEMGILALYDRINIVQSLDHPTAIAEVKTIMDEAMEDADKGGFKVAFKRLGSKKYDERGYMILREKNFQI